MNAELEKIIYQIDRKIKALEQAKKVLLEEFGEQRLGTSQLSLPSLSASGKGIVGKSPKKKTRTQEIIDLLNQEGPLTRSEIRAKVTIPSGSMATVLSDKNTFFHDEGGRWHLKAEKAEK